MFELIPETCNLSPWLICLVDVALNKLKEKTQIPQFMGKRLPLFVPNKLNVDCDWTAIYASRSVSISFLLLLHTIVYEGISCRSDDVRRRDEFTAYLLGVGALHCGNAVVLCLALLFCNPSVYSAAAMHGDSVPFTFIVRTTEQMQPKIIDDDIFKAYKHIHSHLYTHRKSILALIRANRLPAAGYHWRLEVEEYDDD